MPREAKRFRRIRLIGWNPYQGVFMNFYIGLILLNIFFVNSVAITWKILKSSEDKEFWETLSMNIIIGIGSLSSGLIIMGS